MRADQGCTTNCWADQKIKLRTSGAKPDARVLGRSLQIEDEVDLGPVKIPTKNSALVFIKPHAVTYPVQGLVRTKLADAGVIVKRAVEIEAQAIDENGLIDTHCGSMALRALFQTPSDLVVPDHARNGFKSLFGLSWDKALSRELVFNAADAAERLGLKPLEVSDRFDALSLGLDKIELGSGFVVGKLGDKYVINGDYLRTRAKYNWPGGQIVCFLVEWDPAVLSWGRFHGEVVGAADPQEAAPGSIREALLAKWEALGLKAAPDASDIGVHASAGPFEGMVEKMNWPGAPLQEDPFGRALLASGVGREMLAAWLGNPAVLFEGEKQSLFKLLEGHDVAPCLERAVRVAKAVA